jgi:predicted RNA binding protein YcfA (HicA-like mRNA interferase family)
LIMVSHRQNWKGSSLSLLDMSQWPSTKAGKVLKALLKIGWTIKREAAGSHRTLARPGWRDYVFSFHDGEEIGPRMLARIAKHTGLTPPDL